MVDAIDGRRSIAEIVDVNDSALRARKFSRNSGGTIRSCLTLRRAAKQACNATRAGPALLRSMSAISSPSSRKADSRAMSVGLDHCGSGGGSRRRRSLRCEVAGVLSGATENSLLVKRVCRIGEGRWSVTLQFRFALHENVDGRRRVRRVELHSEPLPDNANLHGRSPRQT